MMTHMKRTTLILNATLYARLKQRAAAEGRTLADLVDTTLRLGLERTATPRRARVVLPSYDLGPFLADPAARGRGATPGELEAEDR